MYLITNRHLCKEDRYFQVIYEAVLNGVENIIIREKDLSNLELKELFYKIKTKLDNNNIKGNKLNVNLIINSNTKVFEEVNADGIHLPFNLFNKAIKENYSFDKNKILGISTHSIEDVKLLEKIQIEKDINIDYITVSHIYETDCKKNLEPKGLDLLKKVRAISNIKVVALGGINPSNVEETLDYCDDIAIMSSIMKSSNVEKTIKDYLSNIDVKKDAE